MKVRLEKPAPNNFQSLRVAKIKKLDYKKLQEHLNFSKHFHTCSTIMMSRL